MMVRNLIRACTLAVLGALWSAVVPPEARADQSVYVTGSDNEFGTVDLATGSFSYIATLNFSINGTPINGDSIFGLGYGADGKLYGVDSQPDANLFQINPATGATTYEGTIGQSAAGASSDAGGNLYALSQDEGAFFYTLKPPSPTPTSLFQTGISNAGGLVAVTPDGSQLFATVNAGTTWDLVSINPPSGAVAPVGNTGFAPDTGLFVSGTLYGFDVSREAIVTINTATGVGTQVATYSLPNGDVIYAVANAIPEPSSLILGLIGTAIAGTLGLIRRRQRA